MLLHTETHTFDTRAQAQLTIHVAAAEMEMRWKRNLFLLDAYLVYLWARPLTGSTSGQGSTTRPPHQDVDSQGRE